METVKIINVNSNIIKEVSKAIAGDYVGTKEWKTYEDKKIARETKEDKEPSNRKYNIEEK